MCDLLHSKKVINQQWQDKTKTDFYVNISMIKNINASNKKYTC